MNTTLKTCFKCGKLKERGQFYRHKKMADGLLGKCKECTKQDVTKHRNDNLEEIRQYDRSRGNRQLPSYQIEYRHNHPDRSKANGAVARAIRSGKLNRPVACWHCGDQKRVVAHHADYSLPLAVSWLCQGCHMQVHFQTEQYFINKNSEVSHVFQQSNVFPLSDFGQ